MRWFLFLGLMVSTSALPEAPSREEREIAMAEQSVLASIVRSVSPSVRKICAKHRQVCLGGGVAELGLALIGARKTEQSMAALANLLRYRLDGALGTDHACYVLNVGNPAAQLLMKTDARKLRAQCLSEFEKLNFSERNRFDDVSLDSVCPDESAIRNRTGELVAAIKNKKDCEEGDF